MADESDKEDAFYDTWHDVPSSHLSIQRILYEVDLYSGIDRKNANSLVGGGFLLDVGRRFVVTLNNDENKSVRSDEESTANVGTSVDFKEEYLRRQHDAKTKRVETTATFTMPDRTPEGLLHNITIDADLAMATFTDKLAPTSAQLRVISGMHQSTVTGNGVGEWSQNVALGLKTSDGMLFLSDNAMKMNLTKMANGNIVINYLCDSHAIFNSGFAEKANEDKKKCCFRTEISCEINSDGVVIPGTWQFSRKVAAPDDVVSRVLLINEIAAIKALCSGYKYILPNDIEWTERPCLETDIYSEFPGELRKSLYDLADEVIAANIEASHEQLELSLTKLKFLRQLYASLSKIIDASYDCSSEQAKIKAIFSIICKVVTKSEVTNSLSVEQFAADVNRKIVSLLAKNTHVNSENMSLLEQFYRTMLAQKEINTSEKGRRALHATRIVLYWQKIRDSSQENKTFFDNFYKNYFGSLLKREKQFNGIESWGGGFSKSQKINAIHKLFDAMVAQNVHGADKSFSLFSQLDAKTKEILMEGRCGKCLLASPEFVFASVENVYANLTRVLLMDARHPDPCEVGNPYYQFTVDLRAYVYQLSQRKEQFGKKFVDFGYSKSEKLDAINTLCEVLLTPKPGIAAFSDPRLDERTKNVLKKGSLWKNYLKKYDKLLSTAMRPAPQLVFHTKTSNSLANPSLKNSQ